MLVVLLPKGREGGREEYLGLQRETVREHLRTGLQKLYIAACLRSEVLC
jgi:hypothetical protein